MSEIVEYYSVSHTYWFGYLQWILLAFIVSGFYYMVDSTIKYHSNDEILCVLANKIQELEKRETDTKKINILYSCMEKLILSNEENKKNITDIQRTVGDFIDIIKSNSSNIEGIFNQLEMFMSVVESNKGHINDIDTTLIEFYKNHAATIQSMTTLSNVVEKQLQELYLSVRQHTSYIDELKLDHEYRVLIYTNKPGEYLEKYGINSETIVLDKLYDSDDSYLIKPIYGFSFENIKYFKQLNTIKLKFPCVNREEIMKHGDKFRNLFIWFVYDERTRTNYYMHLYSIMKRFSIKFVHYDSMNILSTQDFTDIIKIHYDHNSSNYRRNWGSNINYNGNIIDEFYDFNP